MTSVNRRAKFAYERGLFYFEKVKNCEQNGNILGCAYIDKLAQARRIYDHYNRMALAKAGIKVNLKKYNPL